MKLFVLSFAFSLITVISFAQQTTAPDQASSPAEVTMAELPLKPMRLPLLQEVSGSPFLNAEYITGVVQIDAGRTVTNVPVKFNIFNNFIMVQRDGEELKLESFDLVSFDDPGNGGNPKHLMFKQGYPEIDNRPPTAVYQVLSYGTKLHLLKFLSQKVEDVQTLGDYSRREIVTTQQLYVYIPGGEIKKIKPGKQAFADVLPAMSAKIEEIIKSGNLNLKNESDLVALADALNKQ